MVVCPLRSMCGLGHPRGHSVRNVQYKKKCPMHLPAQDVTASDAVSPRQPELFIDGQQTQPCVNKHTTGILSVEKSSSSPLSKALKDCERVLRNVAHLEKAASRTSRPVSQPPAQQREWVVLQQPHYSPGPVSHAAALQPMLATNDQ